LKVWELKFQHCYVFYIKNKKNLICGLQNSSQTPSLSPHPSNTVGEYHLSFNYRQWRAFTGELENNFSTVPGMNSNGDQFLFSKHTMLENKYVTFILACKM